MKNHKKSQMTASPKRSPDPAASPPLPDGYQVLLGEVSSLQSEARKQAGRAVNSLLVASCLELGRKIDEFEQGGRERADYGAQLIERLSRDLTEEFGKGFSWRDMILIAGGLFLVWKATKEIHHSVDPDTDKSEMIGDTIQVSLVGAIFQILLLDLVFSIDSIITAVGMTDEIAIMYIAVIVAVTVMLLAVNPLSAFIEKNPTIVMLALGFLLMIGMTLIADGMGYHVPKGYIYAAMAFSALVEGLNMLDRRARQRLAARRMRDEAPSR